MNASAANPAVRPSSRTHNPWLLLALLVLAMGISFFDRGNLAVAAPLLVPQLHLSTWRLGLLFSAFFWSYSACQIAAGWLVDRVEIRVLYAVAFCLWSLATLSTSLVTSFGGLLMMRLLLGVGESVTYPATSHILASTFPEGRRGLANSLVDLGARIGPAAGTFLGSLLLVYIGWRGLFLVTGVVGLLWIIPWLLTAPRLHASETASVRPCIGWKLLLSRRSVWGTVGGLCGANYAWYFILSWLPTYLAQGRHLSFRAIAVWGSLPYVLMAFSSLGGGIFSDRLIRAKHPAVKVRKSFLVIGLSSTAILLPVILVPKLEWALAGLLLSCLAFGVYASNLYSLTQTLAGPEASGRWTGLQNACGNMAGIGSTLATGWLVQKTGTFSLAFLAASVACLLGASSFWLLVRDETPDIFNLVTVAEAPSSGAIEGLPLVHGLSPFLTESR